MLLVAAAVVAALGTALVFLYVRGADNRAEEKFETTDVLVATVQIERGERIAEDPVFAEEVAELDQRIEDEARARLQALDDQRALRKAGVRSVDDIDEDDDFFDDEDDDGPEIIYVRD